MSSDKRKPEGIPFILRVPDLRLFRPRAVVQVGCDTHVGVNVFFHVEQTADSNLLLLHLI